MSSRHNDWSFFKVFMTSGENQSRVTSSLLFWQSSLLRLPVSRYGYHVSKTSYVICNDPPTIQKIFGRIRNFDGEGSYPKMCGGVQIVQVRDVTTGYDSSQADLRSVRRALKTAVWGVSTPIFGFCYKMRLCVFPLEVLPVSRSSQMITFTLQNGVVATLRTSGTEPKIKYYTEFCAAPGKRSADSNTMFTVHLTHITTSNYVIPVLWLVDDLQRRYVTAGFSGSFSQEEWNRALHSRFLF